MDIAGKTAIVTGGASGLGLATVERYAADGANVAIFDLNEEVGPAVAKLSAHIVDNDYINGECIRMDAAIRMQPK
ncbi:SDR family NAD(P)-dependent oxidoreductase [Pseudomaricurvus alcaniphilus]|uniref:SDR family NAD(P)-dependent oxidoreductase n=1 Tax=Pseudomaricurvus alcaniphilus TaxID=1166482 RepID=UPI00140D86B0|nr:SDR family NAD(P)-dependent oxidoreductase [Pseudomaricurvus alcaniphilus]